MVEVDLRVRAQKSDAFLALNRFGQVPVLEDEGLVLADSNAILVYLATRYAHDTWLPRDPAGAARVHQWLSIAAGPLASGPATARLATVFGANINATEAIARANALFTVMEGVLAPRPFLVGDRPTLADVALYTYTAHAPEGNVDLAPYPQVRGWLSRIEALPGFVPMQATPVGLAA